ncbi:hypothetical protein ACFVX6_16050 [Streptomyces sp. NPDC058289]|uniref:hypothetical protein n=1 Tax=Streptomyces sp. NPDC058289 TaxID=3346425 RepID=UPI0036E3F9B7
MTTEPEREPVDVADVHAAHAAIDAYLRRTDSAPERLPGRGRVADGVAEAVAREAWDSVIAITPPPPDPATDPGPAVEPPEVAERRAEAMAIARGLQLLGYRLDETLLPGPDIAAG